MRKSQQRSRQSKNDERRNKKNYRRKPQKDELILDPRLVGKRVRALEPFRNGLFTADPSELRRMGFGRSETRLLTTEFQTFREAQKEGFIGEWGYWMMLQAWGLYRDEYCASSDSVSDCLAYVRVNRRASQFPVNSCCFVPAKPNVPEDIITRANGTGWKYKVFPYCTRLIEGAMPDLYIGKPLNHMTAQGFNDIFDPATNQGYRVIEVKTTSRTMNEYQVEMGADGKPVRENGKLVMQKDAKGRPINTGKHFVRIHLNHRIHRHPDELLVIAKRNRRGDRAKHLGYIRLGDLERLQKRDNLYGNDLIRLDWLTKGTENLVREILNRCDRYNTEVEEGLYAD